MKKNERPAKKRFRMTRKQKKFLLEMLDKEQIDIRTLPRRSR